MISTYLCVHLLFQVWLSLPSAGASTISIVDSLTSFPFLRSVDDPSNNMRWDSGKVLQMISSCKLIRVTRLGVRCISAGDQLIDGWQDSFLRSTDGLHTKRKAALCLPLMDALCVMDTGRRFFPTDNVFVMEKSVTKCLHGQGRRIVPDIHTEISNYTNSSRDDISLCDVLDTNLDVIYDPVDNHILTRQLSDTTWLYVSMSVLILVVVVLTAEAVSQNSRSKLTHNMIAWLLLAGISILMLTHTDGRMHMFVSIQDRAFVTMSFIYIVASTVYWFCTVFTSNKMLKSSSKSSAPSTTPATKSVSLSGVDTPPHQLHEIGKPLEPPNNTLHSKVPSITPTPIISTSSETQRDGINAMLGSIHFATCVLYGTPDNVYVSAFFFIFLFRCMQKLYDAHHNPDSWTMFANTVLLLDVTYTTVIFSFGVVPHFTNEAETTLYAAAQYVICDTIAYNSIMSVTAVVTAIATNPLSEPAPAKIPLQKVGV
jgi:hypothetical protein